MIEHEMIKRTTWDKYAVKVEQDTGLNREQVKKLARHCIDTTGESVMWVCKGWRQIMRNVAEDSGEGELYDYVWEFAETHSLNAAQRLDGGEGMRLDQLCVKLLRSFKKATVWERVNRNGKPPKELGWRCANEHRPIDCRPLRDGREANLSDARVPSHRRFV